MGRQYNNVTIVTIAIVIAAIVTLPLGSGAVNSKATQLSMGQ